ncbi:MAG: hypothetical protein AB7I18_04580 [Candidatus Berkiella sp.]
MCTVLWSNLVGTGLAQRQTASNYLRQLAAKGVLNEVEEGREKVFINSRFMELLLTDKNSYAKF